LNPGRNLSQEGCLLPAGQRSISLKCPRCQLGRLIDLFGSRCPVGWHQLFAGGRVDAKDLLTFGRLDSLEAIMIRLLTPPQPTFLS
jgi:hypothetical protein